MSLNDLSQTVDAKTMFCVYQRRRAVIRGLWWCLVFLQGEHSRQGHERLLEQWLFFEPGVVATNWPIQMRLFFPPFVLMLIGEGNADLVGVDEGCLHGLA